MISSSAEVVARPKNLATEWYQLPRPEGRDGRRRVAVHTCGRVKVESHPGPDEPCAYEKGSGVEAVGE